MEKVKKDQEKIKRIGKSNGYKILSRLKMCNEISKKTVVWKWVIVYETIKEKWKANFT